jgi:hypothetical protein
MTTGDGVRCRPLTVIDAFSRFCIRCELVAEPTSDGVMHALDGAFREYGLPAAIRSDNGPPFASTGAGGLAQLAVWSCGSASGSNASRRANPRRTAGKSASTRDFRTCLSYSAGVDG